MLVLDLLASLINDWTPVIALLADGERHLLRITDWVEGGGEKPPTGFLGSRRSFR